MNNLPPATTMRDIDPPLRCSVCGRDYPVFSPGACDEGGMFWCVECIDKWEARWGWDWATGQEKGEKRKVKND